MASAILDIVVITLLLVTIMFCWRLNNKILELKHNRRDLTDLVKTFDTAIIKTHKNISELKGMSASSTAELQSYLSKANELIGDLSFMTETASKLADRLEKNIVDMKPQHNDSLTRLRNEQLEQMISNLGNSNQPTGRITPQVSGSFAKTKNDLLAAIKMAKSG
jgi:chromosome segregation ATPase